MWHRLLGERPSAALALYSAARCAGRSLSRRWRPIAGRMCPEISDEYRSKVRGTNTVERLDLGSSVELTHLRHEAQYSGSLELSTDVGEMKTIFADGTGGQRLPDLEPLSQIVDTLNERLASISPPPTSSCSTSTNETGCRTRKSPTKPATTPLTTSNSSSTGTS